MKTKLCQYCNKQRDLKRFAANKRKDNVHPIDMCKHCKWVRRPGAKDVTRFPEMNNVDDVAKYAFVWPG